MPSLPRESVDDRIAAKQLIELKNATLWQARQTPPYSKANHLLTEGKNFARHDRTC
jgi:hypothetical protein